MGKATQAIIKSGVSLTVSGFAGLNNTSQISSVGFGFASGTVTSAQNGTQVCNLQTGTLAPTPAPPGVVSGLIGISMGGAQFGMMRFRKRRRAAKDAIKSTVTVSE